MQPYLDTFVENLIKGIPNLLTALAIFIGAIYLGRVLSRVLGRVLKMRNARMV